MSAPNSFRWTPQLVQSKFPTSPVGLRDTQTCAFNTSSRDHQRASVDCEGCTGREASCLGAINTSIFREDFAGKSSAKVRPAYRHTLETIREEDGETDGGRLIERGVISKRTLSVDAVEIAEGKKGGGIV